MKGLFISMVAIATSLNAYGQSSSDNKWFEKMYNYKLYQMEKNNSEGKIQAFLLSVSGSDKVSKKRAERYKDYVFFRPNKTRVSVFYSKDEVNSAVIVDLANFIMLAPKYVSIESLGNEWIVVVQQKEEVVAYFPAKIINQKTVTLSDKTSYDVYYIQIN